MKRRLTILTQSKGIQVYYSRIKEKELFGKEIQSKRKMDNEQIEVMNIKLDYNDEHIAVGNQYSFIIYHQSS